MIFSGRPRRDDSPRPLFWGTNPAFAFPQESLWKTAAARIPVRIRIGLYEDETALDCQWRLPEHHWLEAWGDFEPAADLLSLRQPAIGSDFRHPPGRRHPAFVAAQAWVKTCPATYLDYLKARWQTRGLSRREPRVLRDLLERMLCTTAC